MGMMRKIFRFFFLAPLSAAVLLSGCRSAEALDEPTSTEIPEFIQTFDPDTGEFPQGFLFRPDPVPNLDIPPDVGTLSEYPSANSGDPVVLAFREAYAEALLRGLPLKGVLGGDRVHFWLAGDSRCRIQNWISDSEEANSWGVPGLVLAIGEDSGEKRYGVYTVSGRFLDRYSRSPGPNTGNGAAAYGYPVGEVFYRDGAAVQRFSKGSIVVDKKGAVFIPAPEEAESPETGTVPEIAGVFYEGEALSGKLPKKSDGPVASVAFPEPWIMPGSGIPVSGIHVESYDEGKSVFVVVDSPALPKRVRFLTGSFLAILLHPEKKIPGAENETSADPVPPVNSPYVKALLEGFSLYGVPLGDSLPLASTDEDAGFLFQEAQRFSKGWIIAPAGTAIEPDPVENTEETTVEDVIIKGESEGTAPVSE
jgi:hypothetical protein